MNRIDRLFATLLLFQARRRLRAEDLASLVEVSRRTIYRDMAALTEMGVPLVSLPGEGYELMPGYYLPPLVFDEDGAASLFLGAQMLLGQAEGQPKDAGERALTKLMAALPARSLRRAERLAEIVRFLTPEQVSFNLDDPHLVALQMAVLERHPVLIRYHSYSRDETTERVIEPARLYYD